MNDLTDQQLLHDYAVRRSELAFAELVRRHIDLVHSAAQRMVGDAHLARDVTQATFVALAQQAAGLANRPTLSGWLHTTARNLAVKSIRTDVRRRQREQEAATMKELLSTAPDASWEEIAPHLDAALGELSEPDRDAVLLRYFEKKSATEIGSTLGISAEAAQKRVSRSVERLREFFAKRGVTVGASGLVVVISANAVQAAPVGLAVTISAAALTATAATATNVLAATNTIAMTIFSKIIIGTALTVAIGTGIYQAQRNSALRSEIDQLKQQHAGQLQQLENAQKEATDNLVAQHEAVQTQARKEFARLRGELAMARTKSGVQPEPATIAPVSSASEQATPQTELPKDSWRDAGFASVEEALQTRGWAVLNGNRQRFKESIFITPEARQIMEKMLEDMINAAPPAERKKFSQMILDNDLGLEEALLMPMVAENQAKGYTSYQIISQDPVAPDETVLHVATTMSAAPTKTETLRFKRFDSDWKLVIDAQFMKTAR